MSNKKTDETNTSENNQDIIYLSKEISAIRQEINVISDKVDFMLEILNTLTVFIEDHDESIEEIDTDDYETNEGWLPELSEWEKEHNEDMD